MWLSISPSLMQFGVSWSERAKTRAPWTPCSTKNLSRMPAMRDSMFRAHNNTISDQNVRDGCEAGFASAPGVIDHQGSPWINELLWRIAWSRGVDIGTQADREAGTSFRTTFRCVRPKMACSWTNQTSIRQLIYRACCNVLWISNEVSGVRR